MLPEFGPFLECAPVAVPINIIRDLQDTVVPLEEVRETARKVFSNSTHKVVDDNHILHHATDTIEWEQILS